MNAVLADIASRRSRIRPIPSIRGNGHTQVAKGRAHHRVPSIDDRITVLRIADTATSASGPPDANPGDPGLIAALVSSAVVEVVLGSRPVAQLARWLAPGVLVQLRDRVNRTASARQLPRLAPVTKRMVMCHLDAAIEVAAVVDDSRRVRAVALRLEPHRTVWRVTALEIG